MANRQANTDTRLYEKLIRLKTHLRTCKECHSAQKAGDPYLMCRLGLTMTLGVATSYDSIIGLRIKARESGQEHIFPCPKLSAHGKVYELTAIPVIVTGMQDVLF